MSRVTKQLAFVDSISKCQVILTVERKPNGQFIWYYTFPYLSDQRVSELAGIQHPRDNFLDVFSSAHQANTITMWQKFPPLNLQQCESLFRDIVIIAQRLVSSQK